MWQRHSPRPTRRSRPHLLIFWPLLLPLMWIFSCAPAGPGGDAGPPTTTRAVAGDGQQAPVDRAVPIAPRMIVTDADGAPVPGVAVSFVVREGGGRIEGAEQRTGADGTAALGRWVLGPRPGANVLAAEVAGLAPVNFSATGLADGRGGLTVLEGDLQYARVGTAVAVRPAVRLSAEDGAPVAGRAVTFRVTRGGGRLDGAEATTDAQGVARVGAWVLGPEPGDNSLEAVAAGLPPAPFSARGVSADAPAPTREVLLAGLDQPWDLAFLPDGTLLYTERPGRLSAVRPGQAPRVLARPGDVSPQSQSGLLGVAVDPAFAQNRYLYTYQSSNRGGAMDNRVRKWRLAADLASATEVGDILTGIPWGAGGGHSGGRIRFGPDGYLYITTGDTRAATVPQDLRGLGGKLLRITTEGAPAPGNPELGPDARREIFAYGFRNPQGLAFRPGSGALYLCEHGPNQDDEVTRVTAGGNGGWDPDDGRGNYSGYSGARMTDLGKFPGALRPAFVLSDSEGMSGCDFLDDPRWRRWDGQLAIGLLAGRRLVLGELRPEGLAPPLSQSSELVGSAQLRAVVRGPDGDLYIATSAAAPGGEIWRVRPR